MKRRSFIQMAAWTAPVIAIVSLPVHAQTSSCGISDVIGDWEIGSSDQAEQSIYTLNESGIGDNSKFGTVTWTIDAGKLVVTRDNDQAVMTLSLYQNCNTSSGFIVYPNGEEVRVSGSLNGFIN